MKNFLILTLFVFALSACSNDVHKQYTKCGTKQSKKKVAYYLSIPHQ
jgi:hypothetical protein